MTIEWTKSPTKFVDKFWRGQLTSYFHFKKIVAQILSNRNVTKPCYETLINCFTTVFMSFVTGFHNTQNRRFVTTFSGFTTTSHTKKAQTRQSRAAVFGLFCVCTVWDFRLPFSRGMLLGVRLRWRIFSVCHLCERRAVWAFQAAFGYGLASSAKLRCIPPQSHHHFQAA